MAAVARPYVPASTVVQPATIAPVIVTGGTDAQNRTFALAMFHGLNLAGHDIKRDGAWRIIGTLENDQLTWTITKPDGSPAGSLTSRPTDPGISAVVPGVLTYLPRPSTRT